MNYLDTIFLACKVYFGLYIVLFNSLNRVFLLINNIHTCISNYDLYKLKNSRFMFNLLFYEGKTNNFSLKLILHCTT